MDEPSQEREGERAVKMKSQGIGCCSAVYLKYAVGTFNSLFLLSGLLFIGLGGYFVITATHFVPLLHSPLFLICCYFLLGNGCFIVLVMMLGCLGLTKEKKSLLILFSILLLFVFLTEAGMGALAYFYNLRLPEELESTLNFTITQFYRRDETTTLAIDRMHSEFHCCGSRSVDDWRSKQARHVVSNESIIPESCCISREPGCSADEHPSNINEHGCWEDLWHYLETYLATIAALGLGFCVLQLFGILFACCLGCKLGRMKYRRRIGAPEYQYVPRHPPAVDHPRPSPLNPVTAEDTVDAPPPSFRESMRMTEPDDYNVTDRNLPEFTSNNHVSSFRPPSSNNSRVFANETYDPISPSFHRRSSYSREPSFRSFSQGSIPTYNPEVRSAYSGFDVGFRPVPNGSCNTYDVAASQPYMYEPPPPVRGPQGVQTYSPRAGDQTAHNASPGNQNIYTQRSSNQNIYAPRSEDQNMYSQRAADQGRQTPRSVVDQGMYSPRPVDQGIYAPRSESGDQGRHTPRAAEQNIYAQRSRDQERHSRRSRDQDRHTPRSGNHNINSSRSGSQRLSSPRAANQAVYTPPQYYDVPPGNATDHLV